MSFIRDIVDIKDAMKDIDVIEKQDEINKILKKKSITKWSKDAVMQFPVLMSDSLSISAGEKISVPLEKNYATLIELIVNLNRLHHLWMEYMRYVTRGKISPKKVYIHNHELDYATTLYYFLVAEDGGTILYANKYTGVFPTNTPDSSFSYSTGDDIRLSYDITYKWVFSDNYRYINIFQEFNNRTRANRGSKVPVFNTKTNTVTNTWVRNAYIELDRASRNYMLRFTN